MYVFDVQATKITNSIYKCFQPYASGIEDKIFFFFSKGSQNPSLI